MRIIVCSSYLEHQQERAERAAGEALRRAIARPRGFWRRVGWWLSGREVAARLARLGEARDREGDALRYAQGREGEELLARVLARHLDDRFTLLRNYPPLARRAAQLRGDGAMAQGERGRRARQGRQDAGATEVGATEVGATEVGATEVGATEGLRDSGAARSRGGDVDAVLVGPHGVTLFEVKAWRGYYRVSGDVWYSRAGPHAGWRPVDKNPSAQALANAGRLTAVLKRAGLGAVLVRPVVAIAGRRMVVEVEPPLAVALFFATQPQRDLEAELGAQVLDDAQTRAVLSALLPLSAASR